MVWVWSHWVGTLYSRLGGKGPLLSRGPLLLVVERLPVLNCRQRKLYRRLVLLEMCPALVSDWHGDGEGLVELGILEGGRLTEFGRRHAGLTDGMRLG